MIMQYTRYGQYVRSSRSPKPATTLKIFSAIALEQQGGAFENQPGGAEIF